MGRQAGAFLLGLLLAALLLPGTGVEAGQKPGPRAGAGAPPARTGVALFKPAGLPADALREYYDALIIQAANEAGVDAALVRAIVTVESGYDPTAVSRKGAKGLMQLMPETASRFAVFDPLDPAANIRGGVRYLRLLQEMFPGRLPWVLAAYNAGENAVLRHGGIPPYRETQGYVKRVLANYAPSEALAAQRPPMPGPAPETTSQTLYRMVQADLSVTYSNVAAPQTR